jgi:hypothetical protein
LADQFPNVKELTKMKQSLLVAAILALAVSACGKTEAPKPAAAPLLPLASGMSEARRRSSGKPARRAWKACLAAGNVRHVRHVRHGWSARHGWHVRLLRYARLLPDASKMADVAKAAAKGGAEGAAKGGTEGAMKGAADGAKDAMKK